MGLRKLVIGVFFIILTNQSHAQKPLFSFGVIADIQYADQDDKGSRFYRSSLSKLDSAVHYLNERKLAFNVIYGDLVDQGTKDLGAVLNRLSKSNVHVYNILGNHDYVAAADKDKLYKEFNMPSPYYSFTKKKWRFIILNTNEVSEFATNEGSKARADWEELASKQRLLARKNVAKYNGGISKVQMVWLETEILEAEKKGQSVLVFSHHPLFPENGLEALNNREILELLAKYKHVKGVISGHHHPGNFGYYKNIPVITLEGMVETSDQNAFGIVYFYKDRFEIEGVGRLKSRVIRF